MSNSDSFIQEVSEEVQRDKFFAALKKYGWIGVVAILAIVGGTAWSEWRKSQAEAESRRVGGVLRDAIDSPDTALAELGAIDASGPALAPVGFAMASAQLENGDSAGAVETLNGIATNGDLPQVYRDLAALKALMLPIEGRSDAERRSGLEALANPGAPFRLIAAEQIVMIDLAAGEIEAAIAGYSDIVVDAEASRSLKERGVLMIQILGGEVPEGVTP